jgi:hypothetical protein
MSQVPLRWFGVCLLLGAVIAVPAFFSLALAAAIAVPGSVLSARLAGLGSPLSLPGAPPRCWSRPVPPRPKRKRS